MTLDTYSRPVGFVVGLVFSECGGNEKTDFHLKDLIDHSMENGLQGGKREARKASEVDVQLRASER